jgi:hypothetical protein
LQLLQRYGLQRGHIPQDRRCYALSHSEASDAHLAWSESVNELKRFNDRLYSDRQIPRRMTHFAQCARRFKTFLLALVANLSYRSNHFLDRRLDAIRVPSPVLGAAPWAEAGIQASSRVPHANAGC